jgi:hypothetical protein
MARFSIAFTLLLLESAPMAAFPTSNYQDVSDRQGVISTSSVISLSSGSSGSHVNSVSGSGQESQQQVVNLGSIPSSEVVVTTPTVKKVNATSNVTDSLVSSNASAPEISAMALNETIPNNVSNAVSSPLPPSDMPSDMPSSAPSESLYPILTDAGNNWLPADLFPLGECQGDCDDDSECALGLICYQRYGDEPVPYCSGPGSTRWDYCARPLPNQLVVKANYGQPPDSYPLKECQADCDYDYDCEFGLSCLQRDDMEEVPGCVGSGRSGYDYCYKPGNNTLVFYGLGGLPYENYPLQKCQGDCRNDNHCDTGLSCFLRTASEPIPGCLGAGEPAFGYCYDPDDVIILNTTVTDDANLTAYNTSNVTTSRLKSHAS